MARETVWQQMFHLMKTYTQVVWVQWKMDVEKVQTRKKETENMQQWQMNKPPIRFVNSFNGSLDKIIYNMFASPFVMKALNTQHSTHNVTKNKEHAYKFGFRHLYPSSLSQEPGIFWCSPLEYFVRLSALVFFPLLSEMAEHRPLISYFSSFIFFCVLFLINQFLAAIVRLVSGIRNIFHILVPDSFCYNFTCSQQLTKYTYEFNF